MTYPFTGKQSSISTMVNKKQMTIYVKLHLAPNQQNESNLVHNPRV